MSRLLDDMETEAARLDRRAAGYRMAGERVLARTAHDAADRLRKAGAALKLLADQERGQHT